MSCYWQGSSRASGLRHRVILHSLGQRMTCASDQVCWNCLWIPRCVTHIPVIRWSCRLILKMLGILIGSTWVSCATLMEFFIAMLSHYLCSLQCYILRNLNKVCLMVWKRLCCWLGPPWWWHVGEILSIVGDIGNAIVGAVLIPIVLLYSVSGVPGLIIIVLMEWHVLRDWASQLMIPVYLF